MRVDGRRSDELRPITMTTGVNKYAEGSALITMGDTRVSVPVCGVFEIEDGRIRSWREYFDMKTVAGQ